MGLSCGWTTNHLDLLREILQQVFRLQLTILLVSTIAFDR
jgi:hypothetical protein